jgi:hypothetical protein
MKHAASGEVWLPPPFPSPAGEEDIGAQSARVS